MPAEQVVTALRQGPGNARFDAARANGHHAAPGQSRAEATLVASEMPDPRAGPSATGHGLCPRETEAPRLLGEGKPDREIDAALVLSHRTIMRHVTSVLTKLGVENRTATTHDAVRHGMVWPRLMLVLATWMISPNQLMPAAGARLGDGTDVPDTAGAHPHARAAPN